MRAAQGPRRSTVGLLGTVGLVLVTAGAIQYDKLPLVSGGAELSAEFREAGGLEPGDDVTISGARVGRVEDIELAGDRVRVRYTLGDSGEDVVLGESTGARIVTVTLLGQAALELQPAGGGQLDADDVIPLERTASPYDVTSALSDLTTRFDQIDVAQLSDALGEVSATFADTPEDVRQTLEGLADLSAALSSNDATLMQLLERADNVSGVLAGRNEELTTLLTAGESLLGELVARQQVVVDLLDSARLLSGQLTGLVEDNQAVLGPTLVQVNQVVALLNRNKENLQAAITGARNYAIGFGEAVSSGPFFDAYIQNLTSPATVTPLISGLLESGEIPPGGAGEGSGQAGSDEGGTS